MTLLALVGILPPDRIEQHRAKILVTLWIASCVVTPGADPYSPLIVGAALIALYFLGAGVIRLTLPTHSQS